MYNQGQRDRLMETEEAWTYTLSRKRSGARYRIVNGGVALFAFRALLPENLWLLRLQGRERRAYERKRHIPYVEAYSQDRLACMYTNGRGGGVLFVTTSGVTDTEWESEVDVDIV